MAVDGAGSYNDRGRAMGRRRQIARTEAALQAIIDETINRRKGWGPMSPWEIPTVVACRRVLSDTVMQLPLTAMRSRRPARIQPPLYRRPDPNEPYWLTMARTVDNLTGWGRAWLQPTAWDAADYPLAIRVLDADRCSPHFDTAGNMIEIVTNDDGRRHGVNTADGVYWLPYGVPRKGSGGESPIAGCMRAVEYLSALWDMAGSFWEAGFPSMAVKIATRLADGDAQKIKDQVMSSWARRHEPAVIDNNGTLEPLGNSAVESQLIESIGAANMEIARAFGVMPSIVNVESAGALTYSTTQAEFQKWKALGLGPYLTRIEDVYTQMTQFGINARFDTNELTRADDLARAQYFQIATGGAPWLTADEVRDRAEGLGPMPAADTPAPSMAVAPQQLNGAPP